MVIEDIVDLNIGKPTSLTKIGQTPGETVFETWTQSDNRVFLEMIEKSVQNCKEKGNKPDYYIIMRNCLMKLLINEVMFVFIMSLTSECLSVFYSYWI